MVSGKKGRADFISIINLQLSLLAWLFEYFGGTGNLNEHNING